MDLQEKNLHILSTAFKYENGNFTFEAQDYDNGKYYFVTIEQPFLEEHYGEECRFNHMDCKGETRYAHDAAEHLIEEDPELFEIKEAKVKEVHFYKFGKQTMIVKAKQFFLNGFFNGCRVGMMKNSLGATSYDIILE